MRKHRIVCRGSCAQGPDFGWGGRERGSRAHRKAIDAQNDGFQAKHGVLMRETKEGRNEGGLLRRAARNCSRRLS